MAKSLVVCYFNSINGLLYYFEIVGQSITVLKDKISELFRKCNLCKKRPGTILKKLLLLFDLELIVPNTRKICFKLDSKIIFKTVSDFIKN